MTRRAEAKEDQEQECGFAVQSSLMGPLSYSDLFLLMDSFCSLLLDFPGIAFVGTTTTTTEFTNDPEEV